MYTPIFAMTPYQMTWQTYLTFGLYLLLMIGTGLYFCWRANNNLEDYLLGGRGLGSWVTALSAQASDMSGWLLMGLPGAVYFFGINQMWIAVGLLGGTLLRRLRGFLLLCCRSGLLLGLLGRALLHRLGRLWLLRLLRCRLCGLRRLLGRSGLHLGRLRLLRLIRIDGGNAGDLIVLGQMLKNDGQLMILQRLHIALGRGGVFVQNFGNHLGGETKVPRHISYSVFFQSKHLVHLQPWGWAFRR